MENDENQNAEAEAQLPHKTRLERADERLLERLGRGRLALSRSSEERIRRVVMSAAARRKRPERLGAMILAYLAGGALLLSLAALGLAGIGPLGF